MKEEMVDGGYLVTMGTYTGNEDFNKQIVRQLQLERKIAPFWRGLNDVDQNWTEPQIIAAARGLPIPAPGETPSDELVPRPASPASPPEAQAQNIKNLTVPIGGRTLSANSEQSASNPGSALASPLSSSHPPRASSPFKPRGKALAAVLGGTSRNGSTTEIVPREINLPYDPYVNGQIMEVFLYKDATECPICFLAYPPYLNHTRCCDQPICSECFVQIKRPDPHFPDGHNENDPNNNTEEAAGLLVSEPACCPYCTQPDFGVTYQPPPFRRGLAYSITPAALGSMSAAMSSSSSVNSGNLSPPVGSPGQIGGRRRNQSLSANSPNVILTDRIRPEWATKLQNARQHQARRAAAATALHTAAFLMGNNETRAFRSPFGRRTTRGAGSGGATTSGNNADGDNDSGPVTPSTAGISPGARGSSNREQAADSSGNRRLEDLEQMMLMEAVRMSLASEEERKRKVEKEEKKEAKKREKEEKKAAKAAAKHGGPYEGAGGRSGHSSASGSSLSLAGFGRKRGNSAASNLRMEASVAHAMSNSGPLESAAAESSTKDKGKAVDRVPPTAAGDDPAATPASTSITRPAASPHQPSHLRQMSSASSINSEILDSQPDSLASPSASQDARGSGLSLGSKSGASEDGGDKDKDPSASTEPMFNFRSLAEVVGVSLEGQDTKFPATAHTDEINNGAEVERVEDISAIQTDQKENQQLEPRDHKELPQVTVTPDGAEGDEPNGDRNTKLNSEGMAVDQQSPRQVTQ